jgi:Zn finger protein HypA/HybF involved in hydrogenase expression
MKIIENKKAFTNKEFIKRAENVHKDINDDSLYDYSKSNYIGSKYMVTIICKKCGNEFNQRASHHLNGSGCKKCANKKLSELKISNTDDFIKKSKKIHNNKYSYDVQYYNNKTKIKIHCNECGNDFKQTPQSHLNGNGCIKCAKKQHSFFMSDSVDDFIKKSKLKHQDYKGIPLYNYSEVNYENSYKKVKIKCNKCDKYFYQKPRHHLYGSGCPNCNRSVGEKYIEKELLKNGIEFITQKRFSDCRNKIPLPFDFYLPDYNLCIEYDGVHHYIIRDVHGGFDRLVKQKENDRIKNKYCIDNNINLFRIKYTDNIKNEIKNILNYIKINFFNEI